MVSNLDGQSWKDNIITNPPEDEEKEKEHEAQSPVVKEMKADILDMIDDGVNGRQTIIEKLDYPDHLVRNCIEDMKQENVLEVEN